MNESPGSERSGGACTAGDARGPTRSGPSAKKALRATAILGVGAPFADRAVAAYEHAFILARLARATRENDDAQAALATAAERTRELAASRQQVDAEANKLEKTLAVAREAQPTLASGPADAKREGARLVAARALVAEARLLCGSARLIGADADNAAAPAGHETLADVEKEAAISTRRWKQSPARADRRGSARPGEVPREAHDRAAHLREGHRERPALGRGVGAGGPGRRGTSAGSS